jgi:adenosylcobinamide-phosphate synthase
MEILLYSTGAFVAGFIIDALVGDPQSFPPRVSFIGKLISSLQKSLYRFSNKILSGSFLLILTIMISGGTSFFLLYVSFKISPWLYIVIESILCWQCIALKSLKDESLSVYKSLFMDDLTTARYSLSRIVGRDTENLDEAGITRAAVETVAENASDGVTAPMIYIAIFGSLGGVIYKTVNTLDSMVGYKNEKYIEFGKASAKADDFLNFLPSRICALLVILSSFILRFDGKNSFEIWKRDRRNHTSLNSAQTESAFAGAFEIRLGGPSTYGGVLSNKPYIGDENKEIDRADILRSHKLLNCVGALTFIFCLVIRGVIFALL